jgi:nitroreductase
MDQVALMRRVADLARLAPSVHNTQPWLWRISTPAGAGTPALELWADRSRSLPVSDPLGRNLVISCGCALVYASVAADALGAETTIHHLPDGPDSDLLARLDLTPGTPSADSHHRLGLLTARHTDRRRFTSWPVPEEKLEHLADAGRPWGAGVLPVTEPGLRAQVEDLLEEARRRQLADPRIAAETESWIDHDESDGVPEAVLPQPEGVRGERPTRFGTGLVPDTEEPVLRGTDRVLVVSTADDGPLSWLQAGASLTALWLRATATGLSVVPLSQLVEVQRTRIALEQLMPPPKRVPQVLARVGWQEIGRDGLPRTPRRPLDEVLDVR